MPYIVQCVNTNHSLNRQQSERGKNELGAEELKEEKVEIEQSCAALCSSSTVTADPMVVNLRPGGCFSTCLSLSHSVTHLNLSATDCKQIVAFFFFLAFHLL